jgi:hypothetical protein
MERAAGVFSKQSWVARLMNSSGQSTRVGPPSWALADELAIPKRVK